MAASESQLSPQAGSDAHSPAWQWLNLWRSGQAGDVRHFLNVHGALAPEEQVGVLLVEQRERWQLGQRILTETFFSWFPELLTNAEAAVELIYGEFLLRRQVGDIPTLHEYQERFPAYAEWLSRLFALRRALSGASGTLSETIDHVSRGQAGLTAGPVSAATPPGGATSSLKQFGRYEVQAILGKGGMGVAYRAWDPRLKRVVVLKTLRGPDADDIQLDRFRAEAEAIAQIRHRNVVQVFDVGEHEGQPYIAMEFCEGGSLAEKLMGGVPLPPREAATLVEQIGQGIVAAHGLNIVHRDLKPANVLLTSGLVKVGDFGLAKKLDTQDGQTRTGAVMGTPAYMSPEQAFGASKHVGPATDLYAVGAVLYECLTGRPPFTGTTAADTLDQVRHREPVSIRQLQPSTPIDLETIALKCLQKEPAKRYATAADLCADLQRFLEGRPIVARPLRIAERAWRWCRRNPLAASLLTLVFLSLAIGITATTAMWLTARQAEGEARAEAVEKEKARVQAVQDRTRAEKAEKAAEKDRDQALAAEADIQAFNDFLVKHVLAAARPKPWQGGLGVNVTVAQALEAAEGKLDVLFAGRPKAEATARHEIGMTFVHLGRYDKAEVHLRRALALREQELGRDAEQTLYCQASVAHLLNWSGQNLLGARLQEDTLRRRTATLGRDHPDTLLLMSHLAANYQNLGQLDKALPLLQECLAKQKVRYPDQNDPQILVTMTNLGVWYRMAGQLDKAVPLLEQTFEKRKSRHGADHPDTLMTMWRLGEAYVLAGRLADGIALAEETVKQMASKIGPKNALTQGATRSLDRLRALPECQAAYEQAQAAKGDDHLDTLAARHAFAGVYNALNALTVAEAHYRAVHETARDALGAEHARALISQSELAVLLLRRERFAEAESHLRAWLDVQKAKGRDDWGYFNHMYMLGASLLGQEKFVTAEPLLVGGYEGLKRHANQLPPASASGSELSRALERLVLLYSAWGKKDQAAEWHQRLDTQWASDMKKRTDPAEQPRDR